jgi:hypothetical protein
MPGATVGSMALWPIPGRSTGPHRPAPGLVTAPLETAHHMADLYAVAQRHMEARGMSLRALAKAVHCDPSYLSKALRGLKPCGPKLARDIDDVLAAGGEIVSAALRSRPDHSPVEAPVAPEVVDYFRSQLAGHYTADMYLGPLHLIPTVQTQAELITRLASAADAPVRRGLLDTGAAYAALLGWLYQDAGDLAASARWRDSTLSLAHRSGDPQLVSYALMNKAMLALDQGDGAAVVDFAQAALSNARELAPKGRVLALQHQAQGHAMLGDRASTDRLLDQAAVLVGRVDDEYLPVGQLLPPHPASCRGAAGDQLRAYRAARGRRRRRPPVGPDHGLHARVCAPRQRGVPRPAVRRARAGARPRPCRMGGGRGG